MLAVGLRQISEVHAVNGQQVNRKLQHATIAVLAALDVRDHALGEPKDMSLRTMVLCYLSRSAA